MGTRIKCRLCNDEIVSKHRHDFVRCKCGAIAVDGGDDYLKITGNGDNILCIGESSIYERLKDIVKEKP